MYAVPIIGSPERQPPYRLRTRGGATPPPPPTHTAAHVNRLKHNPNTNVLSSLFFPFQAEHYPPPLYALEWITTLFGLAAQPLVSLVALDLFLAGARNPVLRMCVALLGGMEDDLLALDQEGLLKEFRSRAVEADAEEVAVFVFFSLLFFAVWRLGALDYEAGGRGGGCMFFFFRFPGVLFSLFVSL